MPRESRHAADEHPAGRIGEPCQEQAAACRKRSTAGTCGTTSRAIPSGRTIASANRANCAEDRSAAAAAERRCRTPCPIATTTPPVLSPQSVHPAQDEDFPFGWELKKKSWHFHRRFYRVLRRPMHRGEVLVSAAPNPRRPCRATR